MLSDCELLGTVDKKVANVANVAKVAKFSVKAGDEIMNFEVQVLSRVACLLSIEVVNQDAHRCCCSDVVRPVSPATPNCLPSDPLTSPYDVGCFASI